jgi:seryl-tRNA synthetase
MPGRDDFGEVTSTSNTTDYQARRLRIRSRREEPGGRPRLLHTLNGTALAISRALIALLEVYQQEDGSVTLPKALISHVGKERLEPVR